MTNTPLPYRVNKLKSVINDIERPHRDAGSLAAAVEHHWPKLRAALSLLDAIPPETLEALRAGTWQAVPEEPTDKMIKEGARQLGLGGNFSDRCYRMFCAMLAAAPRITPEDI